MTVVRIKIKKNLTQGAYTYRRSAAGPFATEYVVRSDAAFLSDHIKEYARNIALVESRLYPACVHFEDALIKLATPGASSQERRGEFCYADTDDLTGQLEMPEGEMLAYPPVYAVFGRQTIGRHGRLVLPHALTTSEWNLYVQQQVVPPRFERPNDSSPSPVSDQLIEAIRAHNGHYVMSPGEGDTEASLRKIWDFFFYGFEVNSLKTKRKKSSAAKKAAAKRALLLGSEAGEEGMVATGACVKRTKPVVPGLVYMLQAGPHFKVGMTTNLDKRLTQIKLQLPFAVQVVHTIKAANPSQVESHWHRRFAALRLNGEWFALGSAEVSEFKNVAEM